MQTQKNMTTLSDVGLIGLGVMGANLALNLEHSGRRVSVWNRTKPGAGKSSVQRFLEAYGEGRRLAGFGSLSAFVASLARPRIVIMMVPAGGAVDEVVGNLLPLLSAGDVLVDGGNSHYADTERRVELLRIRGIRFVGAGISGGAEGALHGPAIMPGGAVEARPLVMPLLESIAARAVDGTPCCAWMGPGGAGHFVKMVHNGIEYADMQLIAEAYALLGALGGLDNEGRARCFERWNQGRLQSYLMEITAAILRRHEPGGGCLLDSILDVAGQKGTGRWTVAAALELGQPQDAVAAAVFQRALSGQKERRTRAAARFARPPAEVVPADELAAELEKALYGARLTAYAQGFDLLAAASTAFDWGVDAAAVARLWRGGCIIRSAFLDDIARIFEAGEGADGLLLAPCFAEPLQRALPHWRNLVSRAVLAGAAVPCLGASLQYLHALSTERLPAHLIQAQRDYFGAHTFERIDDLRGHFHHADWTTPADGQPVGAPLSAWFHPLNTNPS